MSDSESKLTVEWESHHRKAQCAPNPKYPTGIDIDPTLKGQASCFTAIPYPAPECGLWIVRCPTCGASAAVTAAGRVDDPRSMKMVCKL